METFLPSVFDRLTDPDAVRPGGRPGYTLAQLRDVLRRDLADLLNTRRPPDDLFDGLPGVRASVANFGLPEILNVDALSWEQRDEFARKMEAVIRAHEPRLTDLTVTARDPAEVRGAAGAGYRATALYFRVVARVAADPTPVDGIVFDTILELSDGRHDVVPA